MRAASRRGAFFRYGIRLWGVDSSVAMKARFVNKSFDFLDKSGSAVVPTRAAAETHPARGELEQPELDPLPVRGWLGSKDGIDISIRDGVMKRSRQWTAALLDQHLVAGKTFRPGA